MRALALMLLGGCVSAGNVTCPDSDLICPAGTACLTVEVWAPPSDEPATPAPTEPRCVLLEDVAQCVDAVKGAVCDPQGHEPRTGECHSGGCFFVTCGNGLQDSIEVCDDGNEAFGDGCSVGCTSDETCGNGILDPVQQISPTMSIPRELCDNNDAATRDGCDDRCQPEAARWRERKISATPNAAAAPRMAYDARHHQFVQFGGLTSDKEQDDTWIGTVAACGDGTDRCLTWTLAVPATKPAARHDHMMAYDAARGQVVLFGGRTGTIIPIGGGSFGDTWVWDGASWTAQSTPLAPPPRDRGAMTYDSRRQRIVLFGGVRDGQSFTSVFADTWEWDGTVWEVKTPLPSNDRENPSSPPPQGGHAMAYDPVRGVTVMFGNAAAGETWEWDGLAWTQRELAQPPGRIDAAFAWDPQSRQLVLSGGLDEQLKPLVDTWKYDGTVWSPAAAPIVGRTQTACATDVLTGEIAVAGGVRDGGTATSDIEFWDGTAWVVRNTNIEPSGLRSHAATYDAARGRVVLVPSFDAGKTWEFDGATWIVADSAGPFLTVRDHAMVYDEDRREVVMFGGHSAAVPLDETWAWKGVGWVPRPTVMKPMGRVDHAMAYDARRGLTVLFGGQLGNAETLFDDTWLLKDAGWEPVTPMTTTPPARARHAMGYDREHGQIVMFGGFSGLALLADTWVFDGADWKQITGPGPSPRESSSIAWSYARKRLVLFGGRDSPDTAVSDTWEWDGAGWVEVPIEPVLRPQPRQQHVMTASRDGVFVIGGDSGDDIWEFRYESIRRPDTCLDDLDWDEDNRIGCADSDCRATCTPFCRAGPGAYDADKNPIVTCEAMPGPRCGDGTPDPLETCRTCPEDFPSGCSSALCGDYFCDAPEAVENCPGDCP